jgi:uncharacterized protein YcgI (DUF1989 family)
LRVIDIEGGQTGDLFAVAADDPADGLSNGRTFDYGGTVRLTTGSVLYSRRSRPLLRIAEDQVGTHDFLYAPCSQRMFEIEYQATGPQPNCFDNLAGALAEFGVPASTVTIAFNFFMNVDIAADGRLTVRAPQSPVAGRGTTFVAERDLFVAVTSCAAANCNGGRAQPVVVEFA